ncbi:hypothetical protein K449DRAFT_423068 [Hypoxylon sp. EC38]|nr:hypothetical protein K449DRAFT_423068 [Hypoxylon sp. EC38]
MSDLNADRGKVSDRDGSDSRMSRKAERRLETSASVLLRVECTDTPMPYYMCVLNKTAEYTSLSLGDRLQKYMPRLRPGMYRGLGVMWNGYVEWLWIGYGLVVDYGLWIMDYGKRQDDVDSMWAGTF